MNLKNVLVVGGGIGGMSAAIALRQRGVPVDLVDIDPDWRVYGAGITITGPTLRAFHRLGVLEDVRKEGYFSDRVEFLTADGRLLTALDTPVLEPGIPASGAILRPALHRILSQRTMAEGVAVRLGVTVSDFTQDEEGVSVRFSDGAEGRYDAIIGADGAYSPLRQRLFPNAPPLVFTGQGCWRLLAPRPPEVTNAQIYFGPGNVKVGISPCSQDRMYLFATLAMPGNPHIKDEDLPARMRAILEPFGGQLAIVREAMGPDSSVNYRPLFTMMLPAPWHEGRVGLIGDAVHPTTPHLASGAGLAVEDGLILAIEMMEADSVEAGWRSFTKRRYARAAMVVESSSNIAALEQAGGREDEVKALMGAGAHALAAPI